MIVLDLDNCIAHDEWRIPQIQWQLKDPIRRYHDYHCLSGFDRVANHHLFEGESDIVILTGRYIMYRPITIEWLKRAGVRYKHLLMRNPDDHRPSLEVKRTHIQWLSDPSLYNIPLETIRAAYDDHAGIVEMYTNAGIAGAQLVKAHNTCVYTHPLNELKQ